MAKVKVTEAQVIAAKLAIEIDEKLGRTTPEAVIRLANAAPALRPQRQAEVTGDEPVKVTAAQVIAAKLAIEIDEKLGRETPEAVIRLASAKPATHPAEASAS